MSVDRRYELVDVGQAGLDSVDLSFVTLLPALSREGVETLKTLDAPESLSVPRRRQWPVSTGIGSHFWASNFVLAERRHPPVTIGFWVEWELSEDPRRRCESVYKYA